MAGIAATACSTIPRPESLGVQVDTGTSVGAFATRLDTQIVYPAVLDEDIPTGVEQLARYASGRLPELRVRLILGTDGAYVTPDRRHLPTLPAGWTREDWDFTSLDLLVGDVFRAGARPVIDIGYMPDWMWQCSSGTPLDPTFTAFGEYAARLVAYYNQGSFVAEDGRTIRNPAGTSRRVDTWELWNEPNFQTLACHPPNTPGARVPPITSAQYLAMWNAAAPRMRAADPTIRLAGPSTSAGVTGQNPDYLPLLMKSATIKPDIATFHGYGSYTADETDGCLFDNAPPAGRACFQGGIPLLVQGLRQVRAWAPRAETWITEVNVLASYGNDPLARNWNALGTAWQASAFVRLGTEGASALFHYSFVHPGGNQFSVLDWTKGPDFASPLLAYWTGYHLARLFPPGSEILKATSTQNGIDTLAVKLRNGEVHVLVVNRKVASSSDIGGKGVATTVDVTVAGLSKAGAVTLWQFDADTPRATGPIPQPMSPASSVSVRFGGYGAAIVEFR